MKIRSSTSLLLVFFLACLNKKMKREPSTRKRKKGDDSLLERTFWPVLETIDQTQELAWFDHSCWTV